MLTPLWLASRSPRRQQMLEQAGFDLRVHPPDFDDGILRPGHISMEDWVTALSFLKAWRVAELLRQSAASAGTSRESQLSGTVLGADTLCVKDGEPMGQPRDADHARRMLHALRDAEHHTITGVSLISLANGERLMFCDRAIVRIGPLTDSQIDEYIASNNWRGKAGGYNLSERIEAGWPIECIGDPTTVMGLPMKRILDLRFSLNQQSHR